LEDVGKRFECALGVNRARNKLLAAPKKIQWAISTSKKIKQLQDRIAVPMAAVGMLLGQQVMYVLDVLPKMHLCSDMS
jgi:hypothetical protein